MFTTFFTIASNKENELQNLITPFVGDIDDVPLSSVRGIDGDHLIQGNLPSDAHNTTQCEDNLPALQDNVKLKSKLISKKCW